MPKAGVTDETVAGIISDLKEMARKPKSLSLKAVVERARPEIISALQQGYSLEDICAVMEKRHIKIAPATLKQYLAGKKTNKSEPEPQPEIEHNIPSE